MQANNDLVHRLQDAQQEQKAAMDMLTKQISQMATMLNEIRGHDGRIPATVKMPDRANISKITLRSGKDYAEPLGRAERGSEELIPRRSGRENGEETHVNEAKKPLPQLANPLPIDQNEGEPIEETRRHEGKTSNEGSSNAVKLTKPYPYKGETKGRSHRFHGNFWLTGNQSAFLTSAEATSVQ